MLYIHPESRFDPAYCGASALACARLDDFQQRGAEVHCMRLSKPAWGDAAGEADELSARFPWVKSVRTLALECTPVAARQYGDEFRQRLYAGERAARGRAFRVIAREPWDACFTTDVTAAPFVHALPRATRKVLAVGDSYARRVATSELVPAAVGEAEGAFAFTRIEAELYRLFDRVEFWSEADAAAARRRGVAALYVPLVAGEPASPVPPTESEHDLMLAGSSDQGDLADAEWFYRHVYLPHLRSAGVRLALAGAVAERFPVADLRVAKILCYSNTAARIMVAPVREARLPCMPVANALAAGRAVVTTPLGIRGLALPDDAAICFDMHRDPPSAAEVIRELLANADHRHLLATRATAFARDTRGAWFTQMEMGRG